MTIKAVVFDLDGTIAEFNLDYKTVRAEAMHCLINQGFPASIFSINESIFEMLKKAKIYMRNNGQGEREYSAIQKKVLSLAQKHEMKAARETSLLPGAFETLKSLKSMNLKLAIFTINSKKSTALILDNLHLNKFLDAVISREDVLNVKPDPAHLSPALKALEVNADEVVVVGDSVVDMGSAKALNVAAIGLTTDKDAAKRLCRAGATHTIKSLTELPVLITQLNERAL